MTKAKHGAARPTVLEGVTAHHLKRQNIKLLKERFEADGWEFLKGTKTVCRSNAVPSLFLHRRHIFTMGNSPASIFFSFMPKDFLLWILEQRIKEHEEAFMFDKGYECTWTVTATMTYAICFFAAKVLAHG
eukprot:8629893-Ditylum_brightwellii.AAC.1